MLTAVENLSCSSAHSSFRIGFCLHVDFSSASKEISFITHFKVVAKIQ